MVKCIGIIIMGSNCSHRMNTYCFWVSHGHISLAILTQTANEMIFPSELTVHLMLLYDKNVDGYKVNHSHNYNICG